MSRKPILLYLLALATALAWLCAPVSAAPPKALQQATFASAEDAVAALIAALQTNDTAALHTVLGPGSEKLLSSGDRYADQRSRENFLAAYHEQHKLVAEDGHTMLDVGNDDWPLPIPIVQTGDNWRFDSHAGAQEIVDRRIGRNEVAAIRVALAYVDAQKDYFAQRNQYAQRLVSTPGRQDGLYWPASGDAAPSPFAPLVAQAVEEGYPGELVSGRPIPYQGYFFRILTAQGPDAPGGAKDYLANGRMTGGFGLIAWPAIYGASGIMSFIVNQDGVVFQKDLGPGTTNAAAAIKRFDPELSWARVDVVQQ